MTANTSTSLTDSRLSAIDNYIKAGFALFPCYPNGVPKESEDGWRATVCDQDLNPEDLGEVYGLNLSSDILVLDVDPRRYERDEDGNLIDEFRKLCAELKLPKLETFIVATGGGGYHVYFTKPSGYPVRPYLKKLGYGALEAKSEKQYVIGAFSKRSDHKAPYTVARGSVDQIMEAPKALLEFIHYDKSETEQKEELFDESEAVRQRFVQFLMTTAPAIEGNGGDQVTYNAACEGKDYGLPEVVCFELMRDYFNPRCSPEWEVDKLKQKVNNAYQYSQSSIGSRNAAHDFESIETDSTSRAREPEDDIPTHLWDQNFTAKGEPKGLISTLSNVVNFLCLPKLTTPTGLIDNPLRGLVRFNEFSQQMEVVKAPPWRRAGTGITWQDHDTLSLKLWLAHNCNFSSVATITINEAVQVIARFRTYHPVRSYLESLTWDGRPRLDNFLPWYAGSPNNIYTREIGKNTLIAAVARVMEPGCQHDHMLVLEGAQGTGKTSFVRVLGGDWYNDPTIDTKSKDTVIEAIGTWFMEAAEMEVARREDVQALKKFITKVEDKIRLPFEKYTVRLPRQFVMIGTVNPEMSTGYLKDRTGNRRFWPVPAPNVKLEMLKRDRDQLFAEAFDRYKRGEKWHITDPTLEAVARGEQSARLENEVWKELIHDWLTMNTDQVEYDITTHWIATNILNISPSRITVHDQRRICVAMDQLGYVRKDAYRKGRYIKVWIPRSQSDLYDLIKPETNE